MSRTRVQQMLEAILMVSTLVDVLTSNLGGSEKD